ncbi:MULTISPECIES: protein L [Aeromonas]|uniref:protein L n=1 Tax=Aeromonas TaxID=642 RepID=UPI000F881347|nr:MULTISPECIES: protein L [Aeromonas]MDX7776590.1 hypothetical protein [Aeromonas hydrophila]RUQ16120.1 protein L [Aeromonas dhakensis]
MANYTKDTEKHLKQVVHDKPWWTETYHPGVKVPVSGIYRCIKCRKEVACNQKEPFPPQNHDQHPPATCGKRMEYKLVVRANTTGE